MSRVATQFTPDDLLNLPDEVNYELVDGNLVERNMGGTSSWVAMQIGHLLLTFIQRSKSGFVFGADAGYVCFPDAPGMVRKPDVSFIKSGRLPGDRTPEGHIPIAPDLAVEVLSPRDLAYDIERKVEECLKAGVREVWIVNPERRTVRIQRADKTVQSLSENDSITGGNILPGFSAAVSEFFPPRN